MQWVREHLGFSSTARSEIRRTRRSDAARRPNSRPSRAFVVEPPIGAGHREYRSDRPHRRPSPFPRGRQSYSYRPPQYEFQRGASRSRSPSFYPEPTYRRHDEYTPGYTRPWEPRAPSPQYEERQPQYEDCQPRSRSRSRRVRWADQEPSRGRNTRPTSPTYERGPSQPGRRFERRDLRGSQSQEGFEPRVSIFERKRQTYSYTPSNDYPIFPLERERRTYSYPPRASFERDRTSYAFTPRSRRASVSSDDTEYEIRSPRPRFSGPPRQPRRPGPRIIEREPDVVRNGFQHLSNAARRAMNRVPDYHRGYPFWAF